MDQPSAKPKFSDYFYNRVTYLGVVLAITIFAIECLLFGLEFISHQPNIYLGILTFVILPPFLILGLILIPVGAILKKKRVDKGLSDISNKKYQFDLSIPSHRNGLIVFLIGSVFLIVMTTIGSYKAYQYTESVEFCGLTCHKVMSPQHTAYLNSPHAQVKCVECHIGEGADWFVHYKLAGVRQLYHFLKNDYPKPIPTPVENLRPAMDTCERCHWPNKFYSSFELQRTYFPTSTEEPKEWSIRMLINVGKNKDQHAGIHAHMYLDNEIYYAAEDDSRQNITWIKSIDKDGKEKIFTTSDSKFKNAPPDAESIRRMDCIDCHNRPTHQFKPPYLLVNEALTTRKVNPEIPNIKSKMMELLAGEYTSGESAISEIRNNLISYYQNEHSEFYQTNKESVEAATEETIQLYRNNFFPEMKTRWDSRPDHIGHLWTQGCFRCHDGLHETDKGEVVSKDCTICHTIIEQGPPGAVQSDINGLEFKHPFDEDDSWKEMNCSDCHTGN